MNKISPSIQFKDAQQYWLLIKNLSREGKLWLISRISESLLLSQESITEMKEKEITQQFLDKYAGAWHSKWSAEKLINVIKESHSSKEPIEL